MTAAPTGAARHSGHGQEPPYELVARRVRLVRRATVVVDDVTLTARGGHLLAVEGPSGSGKSSLLAVLGGVVAPDSGSVTLAGRPVLVGHAAPEVGLHVQGHALVAVLTARENVEVALQARGWPRGEIESAVDDALQRVLLDGIGDRPVDRLSGGQQQRVALARALVHRPTLLIADEPTSELDEATRDHIVGELAREAARGAVVVIATHDADIVAACDAVVRLVDGRVA